MSTTSPPTGVQSVPLERAPTATSCDVDGSLDATTSDEHDDEREQEAEAQGD